MATGKDQSLGVEPARIHRVVDLRKDFASHDGEDADARGLLGHNLHGERPPIR